MSCLQFQKLQTQQVSQLVWKKKFSPFDQAMVKGCTCRSPRRNPSQGGEDEPAEGPPEAPTKDSNTPTLSPAVSRTPTPVPAPAPAPPSGDELFKQFMKAYLKSNQGPTQPLAERERPLKVKVPNVYYGKSHMDCYQFC